MAHSALPFHDVQKLLMSDFGAFLLVKDWRQEIKSKGQVSRFYDFLKSDSKRHLIEFLTFCEEKKTFELEETILTYNRGFQNTGYFRLSCLNGSFAGQPGFVLFIKNVSDEYQAYLRLMQIDAHLSDFFNHSPLAFCVSLDRRVSYICPNLRRLSGFENYHQGRNLNEMFPLVAEQSPASIRRNRNLPKPTTVINNRGVSTIMDTYTQVFQEKGREIHLVASSEALGGRKVENELIRHLVGFKQIADNIPGVLFQVGVRSTGKVEFSYFSEGAGDVLGVEAAQMRKRPESLLSAVTAEQLKRVKDSFFEAAANNKIWEDELSLYSKTSSERWVRVRGTISFRQGVFEISGVIHNITEEKRDLERQYRIQNTLLKIHRHNSVQRGNFEETYQLLAKAIGECLDIHRVSFWSFEDKTQTAKCEYAVSSDVIYTEEMPELVRDHYTGLFRQLDAEHIVCVPDAQNTNGLSSFIDNYIAPNNIGAFVILTIFHNGKMMGLLLVEKLAFSREWEGFEVQFLKSVSEVVSYCKSVNEKVIFESELIYLNSHLSHLVQTRTEELSKKQQLLESKNEEVVSSLRYAKNIQSAILPHKDYFERLFPESFVFYQPKDIVAGDFYWAESMTFPTKYGQTEIAMVAACDCTGHGVPGAMMSMLASAALSRALHQYSLSDPGDILYQVNQILRENMTKSRNEIFDGMDTAMCTIEYLNVQRSEAKVKFSGANSPIWVFRRNHLLGFDHQVMKGNKMSIGLHQTHSRFEVHEMTLQKGDIIYLFSDGFADQFGGEFGKKLKYPRMRDMILDIIHLPMSIQRRCIETVFEAWKGDNEQIDDVLLVGIKV